MPGYSATPLASRLGIKAGMQVHAVAAPVGYRDLLAPLPEGVTFVASASDRTDLVHIFSTRRAELAKALTAYRSCLKPAAMVWVSWPKKSAGLPSEMTGNGVRELALPLGFVDIKVCAVTEVWSGLKLVLRRELR